MMIDRRALLTGSVATLAALPAPQHPILPPVEPKKARYPLPDGVTTEFLHEAAASMRAAIKLPRHRNAYGADRVQYAVERTNVTAEIFERMAAQEEPFDDLDAEMWRRFRELSVKHDYFPS
ncbi:MAG: hypothetical protein U1E62_18490 [Alsobacter sp.]